VTLAFSMIAVYSQQLGYIGLPRVLLYGDGFIRGRGVGGRSLPLDDQTLWLFHLQMSVDRTSHLQPTSQREAFWDAWKALISVYGGGAPPRTPLVSSRRSIPRSISQKNRLPIPYSPEVFGVSNSLRHPTVSSPTVQSGSTPAVLSLTSVFLVGLIFSFHHRE